MTRPEAIEVIVLSTSTNETKAKGRVRKVTFEIPADGPNPFEGLGGERLHIVVVRINNDETPAQEPKQIAAPDKEKRKWDEMPGSTQVVLACQTPAFREYLRAFKDPDLPDDAEACEAFVKGYLLIKSKTELQPGTGALARWTAMYGTYQVWLKYERAA